MHFHKIVIVLTVMLLMSLAVAAAQDDDQTFTSHTSGSDMPFVLLSLYTSEGCSSCPPADALLTQIQADAIRNDIPIYPLAFHVDYWDYLGWEDPYSSSVYSQRQRAYGRAWNSRRIYTPQMIVNGAVGFVGSNAQVAQKQINEALKINPQYQIAVTAESHEDSPLTVRIQYDIKPLQDDLKEDVVLNIALAQNDLVTRVRGGENRGRTLSHNAVVRNFITLSVNKDDLTGQATLILPSTELEATRCIPANTNIVVFVQNPESMEVLGASQLPYPVALKK
ncbi:DUF1223 domain-containing protein [Poriferisphaera sp. WC338]|uniref:DUF1223 domain-containing protein n=1 Tax=Poriferisphaera sp. WC338 TaxID=3425129 RepID=UPI003D8129FD